MFIDDWFEKDFYQKLPLGYHAKHTFGQVFWTHAYYPHEDLKLWRPVLDPNEKTQTLATTFRIESAGQDAFRRSYPLANPSLKSEEEFLVIRAKRRPVILIQNEPPLSGVDNRGFSGKFHRKRCLVAQVYSLVDSVTERPKFNPAIIDRIREMEFPELLFLPRLPGLFKVESMLRLDEIQSVFVSHLEPTEHSLGNELRDVLKSQIEFLSTSNPSGYFAELREALRAD